MPKRFTATEKWADPWFHALPPVHKLLFLWLVDNCDQAGVIEVNLPLAGFQIGAKVTEEVLTKLEGRVVRLQNGKLYLPKFIGFQYGELSRDCKAHTPAFKSLEANGLIERGESEIQRVSKGYPKGMDTLQVKDKNKEKEKEEDQKEEGSGEKPSGKGTREELMAFAVTIGLPASDGDSMFEHWQANGWRNGAAPSKDWQSGMRKWKLNGWHPSQKAGGFGQQPKNAAYSRATATAGLSGKDIGEFSPDQVQ